METAVAYQKNTGPVQVLHRTGAGTEEMICDQKNPAVRFDSFPASCPACFGTLKHEALIGKYQGNLFHVKGFVCPHCNLKVGKIFLKNCRDSTVRFNWQRMEIPRLGTIGRGSE
jgi:hypothetical protein